jgi:hypothetical protein
MDSEQHNVSPREYDVEGLFDGATGMKLTHCMVLERKVCTTAIVKKSKLLTYRI